MKSALALLLVLPLVSAFSVTISNTKETSTVAASSTVLTFTFHEPVSDFDSDSVDVSPAGTTLGEAQRVVAAGEDFTYQRWTVQISDMANAEEYTVSVPAGVSTECTVDGGDCTSAVGAETNEASAEFVFDVAFLPMSPVLERVGPETVTEGGYDAREVKFTLTFPKKVFVGPGGEHGIWAEDEDENPLDVVVTSHGETVWEYYVIGENAHSIKTGAKAGGAMNSKGLATAVSTPEEIGAILKIKTDCISRPGWSAWSSCVDGKQTHTNTPVVVVPAYFGGFDCDLTPVTPDARDCEELDESVSCAARGADACSTFTEGQECDCTADCVSHKNGVGCCPDVNTVCNVGCGAGGCDVLVVDYEKKVICTCDYQCNAFGDCCSDFNEVCSTQLCGYHLITQKFSHDEMCSAGFVDETPNVKGACFCDQSCMAWGDCCDDYFRVCNEQSSCKADDDAPTKWAKCGKTYQDCGCDILCPYYNDCCVDYGVTCAYVSPLEPVDDFVQLTAEQKAIKFNHDNNPNPPPELCDCEKSGLFDGSCCGSQVGYFGRRCSCAADCTQYEDCCSDYADVCL